MTSNPIYSFFATDKNPAPLLLRLWLAGLFFHDSTQKLLGWFGEFTSPLMDWGNGLPLLPSFITGLLSFQLLLSVLLFLGFFTRLVAVGVLILMIAVIALVHWHSGMIAMQYPITIGIISFALVFLGAGPLSVDRAISRRLLPTIG